MEKRNYPFLLTFICLSILSSCKIKDKINEALTFDFTQNTSFTLPSSSIIDLPIDIGTPDINSSSQQAFDNNNTSARLVERIVLSSLDLTITSPDDRTFAFLKSIKIYIRTNDNNEILLAEKQNSAENTGSTISLDTTGENIKTYVAADSFSLRYEVITQKTTNSKTDITAAMVFTVNAKVL
jgi:hypothetical protein